MDEENSKGGSKAELLYNSIKEIKRAIDQLENFVDIINGEIHPNDKNEKETEHYALASLLTNTPSELQTLTERIHVAIANLKKSLI